MNYFIASCPRSGSSLLANLLTTSKLKLLKLPKSKILKGSEFNKSGYFEDIRLMLLNDMIIKSLYGYKYSFLYPPKIYRKKLNKYYDYYKNKASSVYIPKNFINNTKFYTGHDWDNWGITRMINFQKWEKCYKKFDVANHYSILKNIRLLKEQLSKKKNKVFKDSRMVFNLHIFNSSEIKVIILHRKNHLKHIASLRNHYGPNLFKKRYILNTKMVSNHFNLKVQYLSYNSFLSRYNFFFNKLRESFEFIEIDYEDILNKNKKTLNRLEKFIDSQINLSIINT